jgi:hypothetical protein
MPAPFGYTLYGQKAGEAPERLAAVRDISVVVGVNQVIALIDAMMSVIAIFHQLLLTCSIGHTKCFARFFTSCLRERRLGVDQTLGGGSNRRADTQHQ